MSFALALGGCEGVSERQWRSDANRPRQSQPLIFLQPGPHLALGVQLQRPAGDGLGVGQRPLGDRLPGGQQGHGQHAQLPHPHGQQHRQVQGSAAASPHTATGMPASLPARVIRPTARSTAGS